MNVEGLEPCPFCGESERIQAEAIDGLLKAVTCDHCGAHGPCEMVISEAVRQWNERKTPA